jgi:hypothetical protein
MAAAHACQALCDGVAYDAPSSRGQHAPRPTSSRVGTRAPCTCHGGVARVRAPPLRVCQRWPSLLPSPGLSGMLTPEGRRTVPLQPVAWCALERAAASGEARSGHDHTSGRMCHGGGHARRIGTRPVPVHPRPRHWPSPLPGSPGACSADAGSVAPPRTQDRCSAQASDVSIPHVQMLPPQGACATSALNGWSGDSHAPGGPPWRLPQRQ